MLIFQNNTILWTKKMDFQTFIFAEGAPVLLFVVTSIIRNRLSTNQNTFVSTLKKLLIRFTSNKTQLTEFPE